MDPIIIEWEKLIPSVDEADIPLVAPTEDIPESATVDLLAITDAVRLVHRNAVNGTAPAFTPQLWPNRDDNLREGITTIAALVTQALRKQEEWYETDYAEQVAIVAVSIREKLIERLRADFQQFARGIATQDP